MHDPKKTKTRTELTDSFEPDKVQNALVESEERYRTLVNNVKLGIYRSTADPKGRYLEVNKAMEEITGYERQELLNMNVCDLYVHPEERQDFLVAAASGKMELVREILIRKKDGHEIMTRATIVVAKRDNDGRILYFDGFLDDITERNRLETELRDSKEKLQSIFESIRDAVIVCNRDGQILEANDASTTLFGFKSYREISG